jgi:hypothetical protein
MTRAVMKDDKGRGSQVAAAAEQSRRNRAAYLRRKRNGYYTIKLALKTQAQRDQEAATKRANRVCTSNRARASHAELKERRAAFHRIAEAEHPTNIRGVYYQAESQKVVTIGKDQPSYKKVQSDLAKMRKAGEIPYDWFVDHTRYTLQPTTFDSPAEALEHLARTYRKSLWADADCLVQIWLEKAALEDVIYPVTSKYDVPLKVARGYSSLTLLSEAAEELEEFVTEGVEELTDEIETKPVYIYHLGDYDPSGVDAGKFIDRTLRKLAPTAAGNFHFKRIAVTKAQVDSLTWNLPTRLTKKSDTRAAAFGDDRSVELDAIPASRLRKLVEDAILKHLPLERHAELMEEQAAERALMRKLVGKGRLT